MLSKAIGLSNRGRILSPWTCLLVHSETFSLAHPRKDNLQNQGALFDGNWRIPAEWIWSLRRHPPAGFVVPGQSFETLRRHLNEHDPWDKPSVSCFPHTFPWWQWNKRFRSSCAPVFMQSTFRLRTAADALPNISRKPFWEQMEKREDNVMNLEFEIRSAWCTIICFFWFNTGLCAEFIQRSLPQGYFWGIFCNRNGSALSFLPKKKKKRNKTSFY